MSVLQCPPHSCLNFPLVGKSHVDDAGHDITGSEALALIGRPRLILMQCWRTSWMRPGTYAESCGLLYCIVYPSVWLAKTYRSESSARAYSCLPSQRFRTVSKESFDPRTLQSGTKCPKRLQKAYPALTGLCSMMENHSVRLSPFCVAPLSLEPTQSNSPAEWALLAVATSVGLPHDHRSVVNPPQTPRHG